MKRIATTPLFLVVFCACATNKPADDPSNGGEYSAQSSLASSNNANDQDDSLRSETNYPTDTEANRDNADPESIRRNQLASDTPDGERRQPAERTIAPETRVPDTRSDGTVSTPTPANAANTEVDNTDVNERDRSGATKTPMDQNNNQTDLNITQAIRKAVIADDALSFSAKNVKIITQAGRVTLRGPVNTAQERDKIGALASKAAGVLSVDNQLEVKP